jgi:UDP-N-acetylmuramyl pentapeptide phosphotransferase/UDP-N-acetylglucosamine-1-phosphate transferase
MEFDNATIVLILYCILAFVLAFYPAYLIFPRFIRKMKSLGNTGKDVNKRGNIQVAESGGIVAVFSFSLAMFVIAGLASITNFAMTPGQQPRVK